MDSCQKRIGRSTEMPRDEQQSQEPKPGPNVWDTHKTDPPFIATIENNTSNMPTRQNSFFPEGGFGWLVVVAATWCNGSIFAIQNSFSILHVMLVNANQHTYESVSQFQIAWIGALSLGMVFLCSPLVCISTDRFGCRATAVGGSLVAFVGLLTGSFAKSLPLQYLTYGLLFGAGCSFSLQPTLVILGQYFQRRLGLASGLVTAGSSLFSMALPVLLEEVLVPLGLERTFQILSVLPLTQAVLIGATFRPPPNHERHIDAQSNTSQMEYGNQHSHNDRRECGKSGRHRWGNDSTLRHHDDYALSSQEQPPQGTIGNLQKHSTGKPTKSFPNSTSIATISNQETEHPTTSLPNSNSMATMSNQVLSHHWRSDEENKFSGLRIFVTVPSYGLWAFGVAIAVLGYFVPYVHLMSFMEEQFEDSEKKQWILLVCIGASSGMGRLVFGRVGDLLPGFSKIYLQAASFMFLGLASILLPQCLAFEGLAAVCVLLGACDGCLITLMAPVAFQVLGVRQASQGIGYLLGLMALPMTAGPPLAGLLHDQMGNYHLAFYLAGVPPLLGGLLLLFIPRMHHRLWAFQAEMPLGPPRTTMAHAGESLPSQNIFTDGEPNLNERETTEL